jgi:hypothetical protein
MRQSGREDRNLSEVRAVLHRLQGLPAERQSAGPRLAELGFRRGYVVGIASTTTVMVTAALVLVFGYVLPGFEPQATSTPKDDPNRQVASLKLPDASGVVTRSAGSTDEQPSVSSTVGPAATPKDDPNRQVASLKLPDASGVVTRSAGSTDEQPSVSSTVGPTATPKDDPNRQVASLKLPDASGVVTRSAASTDERPGVSTTVGPAAEAAQALMSAGRVQAARQRLLAMVSDGSPEVAWALARSYDPIRLKEIQGADAAPDVAEATRWYRAWYAAAVKQRLISDSVSLEKIIGSMHP